jgi:hypothetical protein
VPGERFRSRAPQDVPQHQGDEDRIVELSRHGDEVRHQVERQRQVGDQRHNRELAAARYPFLGIGGGAGAQATTRLELLAGTPVTA